MSRMIDRDLIATVRRAVGYISSDERIAQYLGVPVAYVAKVRAERHDSADNRLFARPLKGPGPQNLDAECDQWAVRARQGTVMLAEAIRRVRS